MSRHHVLCGTLEVHTNLSHLFLSVLFVTTFNSMTLIDYLALRVLNLVDHSWLVIFSVLYGL